MFPFSEIEYSEDFLYDTSLHLSNSSGERKDMAAAATAENGMRDERLRMIMMMGDEDEVGVSKSHRHHHGHRHHRHKHKHHQG